MASDNHNFWPSDLLEPEQYDNGIYCLSLPGEATKEGYLLFMQLLTRVTSKLITSPVIHINPEWTSNNYYLLGLI